MGKTSRADSDNCRPKIETVPACSISPAIPLEQFVASSKRVAKGSARALRPLHLWHLASLDAPTVAVVWTFSFAWAAHLALPASIAALTGLTVWSVYVGDRLLDVRKALASAQLGTLRERHFFHWRNRLWLIPAAVAAAAAAAWLFFARLPSGWLSPDAAVGAASMGYFARVHAGGRFSFRARHLRVPGITKELLVGVLFGAGCALPAWSLGWHTLTWCGPAAFFAALAWLNCFAIDKWESQDQRRSAQGAQSGTGSNQTGSICGIALALAASGACMAIRFCIAEPRLAALCATGATAALLLASLERVRGRMNPTTLRALADLVMLTPLGLLLR